MRLATLLLCSTLALWSAEDPYAAWAQGRPADAVPALIANAGDHWDRWYDAGLAAAAAEDRGRAVACLARAMTLAPEEADPRHALRALGVDVPASWHERAGPLALAGQGWSAVIVLTLAGLALGWAVAGRRGQRIAWGGFAVLTLAAAPGLASSVLDSRDTWAGVVRATQLLDHAGVPQMPLEAGSLVRLPTREGWAGRVVVRLRDGREGFVPAVDVNP